jgi:hypothetical protein
MLKVMSRGGCSYDSSRLGRVKDAAAAAERLDLVDPRAIVEAIGQRLPPAASLTSGTQLKNVETSASLRDDGDGVAGEQPLADRRPHFLAD